MMRCPVNKIKIFFLTDPSKSNKIQKSKLWSCREAATSSLILIFDNTQITEENR